MSNNKLTYPIVSFMYTNAIGDTSLKTLLILKFDENYLQGREVETNKMKTFKFERIHQDITDNDTGEILSVDEFSKQFSSLKTENPLFKNNHKKTEHPLFKNNHKKTEHEIEVCFTGFASKTRQELEQLAEEYHYTVRKDVTAFLDLLVCGNRAGPQKMLKAEEKGCVILSEQEFRDLIGEIC